MHPANPSLRPLEDALGHVFREPARLADALLHRSAAVEEGRRGWAESQRLEFLGDAILDFLAADWLMRTLPPDTREGRLTALRSQLTCTQAFATVARRINLAGFVTLGVGEELTGGRHRDALLADTLEAVFAALWLDAGLAAVQDAFARLFAPELAAIASGRTLLDNPKGALQELAQERGWSLPAYTLLAAEGPAHAPSFRVRVAAGPVSAEAAAPTKHDAEQDAARACLRLLVAPARPPAR